MSQFPRGQRDHMQHYDQEGLATVKEYPSSLVKTYTNSPMRNRDPHRENVYNILAISLPIVTV